MEGLFGYEDSERQRLQEELRTYVLVAFGAFGVPVDCQQVYKVLPEAHRNVLYDDVFCHRATVGMSSEQAMEVHLYKRLMCVGLAGAMIYPTDSGWTLTDFGSELFDSTMKQFEADPNRYPHIPEVIQATIE